MQKLAGHVVCKEGNVVLIAPFSSLSKEERKAYPTLLIEICFWEGTDAEHNKRNLTIRHIKFSTMHSKNRHRCAVQLYVLAQYFR